MRMQTKVAWYLEVISRLMENLGKMKPAAYSIYGRLLDTSVCRTKN